MFDRQKIINVLLIILAVGLAGGMVLFFIFGERFLLTKLPQKGPLVLIDPPAWVSSELADTIYQAAGGREFPLTPDNAANVAKRLEDTSWLTQVRVQTMLDQLSVRAHWLKPMALVKSGTTRFYVDPNAVVLDHVPLPNLPLVTIEGVPVSRRPKLGRVLDRDDLKAAVALLSLLTWMDQQTVPTKPLLREIETVDVKNFRGRKSRGSAHIVLMAKDQTPIDWGAEIGTWAQFVEASDEEKLARLYTYYQERGTVQGGVKRINLREPREIPQPAQRVPAPGY